MKNYITQGLSAGARWTTQITGRVSLTTTKVCARINFSARPRKQWKEVALLPQSAREREGFAIIQVAEACGRAGGLVGLVAYTLTRTHSF